MYQQNLPWMQQQQGTALPYQTPQQPQQPQSQYLPGTQMPTPPGFTQSQQQPGMLPLEQSYIENIMRLNRGKVGTFYMTFEYNDQWNAKVFKGVVEEAGRDHIIISDPQSQTHYLLLMVNLDYVTFDEPLDYVSPFAHQGPLAQYSPR